MSKVENIHQVVNKKLLPTLIILVLLDININFITGVARVLSKGAQRGPKAKKGGARSFSGLDCPIYLLYITFQRGRPSPLFPPPPPLAKPLIMHMYGNVILSVQGNQFH